MGSAAGSDLLQQLDDAEVDRLLDALLQIQQGEGELWDRLLTISIKPFMDAWNYDQDRVDACCVHILDRSGNPVSFCEFNARTRLQQNQQATVSASGPLSLEVRA